MLDGYFGALVVVDFVGEEHDGDVVESADFGGGGDGEVESFCDRDGLLGEVLRLGGGDGLAFEEELVVGLGGVGEEDGDVDCAWAVVSVEEADLDFAAPCDGDGGAERLVGFHDEGHEVVGLEVVEERGSFDLKAAGAGRGVGWLEVVIGSGELDDKGLGGAGGEERGGLGDGWDDVVFGGDGPEDDAVIAGDSGVGGWGLGVGFDVVAGGGSVGGKEGVGFGAVAVFDAGEQGVEGDEDGGEEDDGESAGGAEGGLAVIGIGLACGLAFEGLEPGEGVGADGEQAGGVEDPALGELVGGEVNADGEQVSLGTAGVSS